MAALILDGKPVRDQIKSECRPRVERVRMHAGRTPGLVVVLVGHNPASESYVRSKTKTAADLGMMSETLTPPESISTEEMLALIEDLNAREDVDGILVQLPLPPQIDAQRVLLAIDPAKDVDGFHPYNVGLLSIGRAGLRPCTPAGVMEMFRRFDIAVAGKNAVVVGRSDIVGKPMAMLLLHANATVTVCHSKTRDLPGVCRGAEILIAAIGRPGMITADYIRPGAVVIDVGINRVDGRIVGDVNAEDAARAASAYTPVPGGVGLLTVAMLMVNTLEAVERRVGLH